MVVMHLILVRVLPLHIISAFETSTGSNLPAKTSKMPQKCNHSHSLHVQENSNELYAQKEYQIDKKLAIANENIIITLQNISS